MNGRFSPIYVYADLTFDYLFSITQVLGANTCEELSE